MIQPSRIQPLNAKSIHTRGEYVLYWMQASVRSRHNHALEYAIAQAHAVHKPLWVCFALMPHYPEANGKHYAFLLQGLRDVERNLQSRGITFTVHFSPQTPEQVPLQFSNHAACIITDVGYLQHQRQWRKNLAEQAPCSVVQVESEAVVPVATASPKEEYAARTLRPKLHKLLPEYLVPLEPLPSPTAYPATGMSVAQAAQFLPHELQVSAFSGGEQAAQKTLQDFIDHKLAHYPAQRNNPNLNFTSNLSPYLHFGHISPVDIALQVQASPHPEAVAEFLEELIVRRELSFNFCFYNAHYASYQCLPEWAQKTLAQHRPDPRAYSYDLVTLQNAQTHDPYWNAAQQHMLISGKMPNYLRMYWGKKVIEWTAEPEQAFEYLLYLNNTYHLDGRDPNSYAGVAWCFGKHDRPWARRSIFGTVRYMNAQGLKRKFDMEVYAVSVENRVL